MDPGAPPMSCTLDLAHYRGLLESARAAGYDWASFDRHPRRGDLFLRHDVRISLEAALATVSLAHELGVTVFMSSHILAEVDRLATRIGIVHRGRLIEELDSEALERHRDARRWVGGRDLEADAQAPRAARLYPLWPSSRRKFLG